MDPEQQPFPIAPAYYEKVWGQLRDGRRLGEIWFPAPPLLLKFLFTSEKLSVQVHPADAYARQHENSAGKTECWYVMEVAPGARLAVGSVGTWAARKFGNGCAGEPSKKN